MARKLTDKAHNKGVIYVLSVRFRAIEGHSRNLQHVLFVNFHAYLTSKMSYIPPGGAIIKLFPL